MLGCFVPSASIPNASGNLLSSWFACLRCKIKIATTRVIYSCTLQRRLRHCGRIPTHDRFLTVSVLRLLMLRIQRIKRFWTNVSSMQFLYRSRVEQTTQSRTIWILQLILNWLKIMFHYPYSYSFNK